MKVVKLITLTYANTQQTTSYINVPFEVSKAIVRQISYVNGDNSSGHSAEYVIITSDMVEQNQPLGMVYNDRDQGSMSFPQTTYEFLNPRNITGEYTFSINKPTVHSGTDTVQLLIEFHD
jgi:hypothetical protein